ncbi:hypothetical protein VTP01DRAFT_10663 [Rhizomucor pusillus]|uniref:uncharacterized protein n=1 Tax=Rhizomucor pusillus TaxID=4840 RepID=UPI0037447D37
MSRRVLCWSCHSGPASRAPSSKHSVKNRRSTLVPTFLSCHPVNGAKRPILGDVVATSLANFFTTLQLWLIVCRYTRDRLDTMSPELLLLGAIRLSRNLFQPACSGITNLLKIMIRKIMT